MGVHFKSFIKDRSGSRSTRGPASGHIDCCWCVASRTWELSVQDGFTNTRKSLDTKPQQLRAYPETADGGGAPSGGDGFTHKHSYHLLETEAGGHLDVTKCHTPSESDSFVLELVLWSV